MTLEDRHELGRSLAGEPVKARPVERAAKWCRRRSAALALVGLLVVLGAAGVIAKLSSAADAEATRAKQAEEQADAERERAEKEKGNAERQLDRAEWMLYARQIRSAQREWEAGRTKRAWEHLNSTRWDFRGFEYGYLLGRFTEGQVTLRGHTAPVWSVAFSPEGSRIASGSDDNTVKVWDARSGQRLLSLKGHTLLVHSVAYSPDGSRIASGGYDKTVKVWDAKAGQELLTLKGHAGFVFSVAYSPDGSRIVSASADNTAKVWDAKTGQDLLTLEGHTNCVLSVAFSPDGLRIASASQDKKVNVWDARSGKVLLTLESHTALVASVAFSPDGSRIVSGGGDHQREPRSEMKVWDARSGKELFALNGHTAMVTSVAYSPDGSRIASASRDDTVKVWDARTGKELFTLKGHTHFVSTVAYSPDGSRIASGGADNSVKVWDATSRQDLLLPGHRVTTNFLAYSPDGSRVASSGIEAETVSVRDARSGANLLMMKGHTEDVTFVAFSPDGSRLASGSKDKTVKVWDARTGQELLTLKGHADAVWSVAFSPDGLRIASASGDKMVKVWDARSGQHLLTLKGHAHSVSPVVFSPDGSRIASRSGDRFREQPDEVKLWDARSGRELLTLKGHTNEVTSLTFSPDGSRIACGSDRTVTLWDARNGQDLLTLECLAHHVASVSFSPDGSRIVAGSHDEKAKVWDSSLFADREVRSVHDQTFDRVALSPDESTILAESKSGVYAWDARTGQPVLDPPALPDGAGKTASGHGGRLRVRLDSDRADTVVIERSPERGKNAIPLSRRDREWLARRPEFDPGRHHDSLLDALYSNDRVAGRFHLRALQQLPEWDSGLHVLAAHLHANTNDLDQAVAHLSFALLAAPNVWPWPNDPKAHERGEMAAKAGDWPRAARAFYIAANRPSFQAADHAALMLARAAANDRVGCRKVASALLRRIRDDQDVGSWTRDNFLRQFRVAELDRAEALEVVALTLPELKRSRGYWHYAVRDHAIALYRAGRFDEADRLFRRAIQVRREEDDASPYLFLAMIARQRGRHDEARRLLDFAEKDFARNPAATWEQSACGVALLAEARRVVNTPPPMRRIPAGD